LARGAQPFEDLDPEPLRELGRGIGKGELPVPINLTEDGVLIDGDQRLKAMFATGRKFIDRTDVRVIPGATAKDALEWSVRLNTQRRQLTVDQKGAVARRLQEQMHWSQARIARAFGVSRPAVSQWLAGTESEHGPGYVEGEDGKSYPVKHREPDGPKSPAGEKPLKHPWKSGGRGLASTKAAAKVLKTEGGVNGLSQMEKMNLESTLTDLIEAAEELLGQLHAPAESDKEEGDEEL
jgi:hypothetical protein